MTNIGTPWFRERTESPAVAKIADRTAFCLRRIN